MAALALNHGATWDPNGRQYKCCCSSCHVKAGTMVIAILEAVCIGLSVVSNIGRLASIGGPYTGQFLVNLVSAGISAIVVGLLFYGLKSQRAGFLIPHLVWQMLSIVIVGIFAVLTVILLATGGGFMATMIAGEDDPERERALRGAIFTVGVILFIAFALALGFYIWFFVVVLNCYRFFRDQADHGHKEGMVSATVTYASGPPQNYGPPAYPPAYPPQATYPPGPDYPQKNGYVMNQ